MAIEKPKLTAKQINEAAEQSLKEKTDDHKVIVTKRSILTESDTAGQVAPEAIPSVDEESSPPVAVTPTHNVKIEPISEPSSDQPPVDEPPADAEPETEVKDKSGDNNDASHDDKAPLVDVAELIDSGKYYLPINSVEKKRAKRVAIVGVLFILLLGAAWFIVALDAGLIQIDGIEPVTQFFSRFIK